MNSYLYEPKTGLTTSESLESLVDSVDREDRAFWLDIGQEAFQDQVTRVGETLDLHSLTVEDILTAESRPIVDPFPGYLYISARILPREWDIGEIETFPLSLVVGKNYLLTFHQRPIFAMEDLEQKVSRNPDKYFGQGVDYLSYQVLDEIVDNYFPVLERFETEIDKAEEEVLEEPDEELLAKISDLRTDLIEIQRTTGPQREMAARLARTDTPYIDDDRKIYFRDIQDDLARITDLLTNYRDLIGGVRDMYLTVISNRMNEVMQTLTIVATIFIPLTFIAGIYGMNFETMPELSWDWGYYGALGVMGSMALGMVYYFKRKDWF